MVSLYVSVPILPLYERVDVKSVSFEYVSVQLFDVNGCMEGDTVALNVCWMPSMTKTALMRTAETRMSWPGAVLDIVRRSREVKKREVVSDGYSKVRDGED